MIQYSLSTTVHILIEPYINSGLSAPSAVHLLNSFPAGYFFTGFKAEMVPGSNAINIHIDTIDKVIVYDIIDRIERIFMTEINNIRRNSVNIDASHLPDFYPLWS